MEKTATEILDFAQASYQRDARLRSYVDAAAQEAMRHFDHVDSEVDRRDIHHAAVLAAMVVQRMTIDGDRLLLEMEAERNHARTLAKKSLMAAPLSPAFPTANPSS